MANLDLYEKVRKVPDEAKKPIKGGRISGFTDINPMWRIKTLTENFGPCGDGWKYEVVSREFVPGGNGEIAVFVDIALKYKLANGEWSEPVYGSGGSMYVKQESTKLYTDDEAPKKALTDAISVACKALGVGADVYWDKDASKYDVPEPVANQPKVQQNKPVQTKQENEYNAVISIARQMIDNITDAESANVAMREMKKLNHIGDSKQFIWQMLKQRTTQLKLLLVTDDATSEKYFVDDSDAVA